MARTFRNWSWPAWIWRIFSVRHASEYSLIRFLNVGKHGQVDGLYNPPDLYSARRQFGANCGPAALAGITDNQVPPAFSREGLKISGLWPTENGSRTIKGLKGGRGRLRSCGGARTSAGSRYSVYWPVWLLSLLSTRRRASSLATTSLRRACGSA